MPKFTLREPLPAEPSLLLPSRLSLVEFRFLLHQLSGRELIIVAQDEGSIDAEIVKEVENNSLKALSFSVSDQNLKDVGKEIRKRVGERGIALFITPLIESFPGLPVELPKETLQAIASLNIPICPLAICRPEDNILKVFHLSKSSPTRVTVGRVLRGQELNVPNLLEEFFSCAEENFSERRFLDESLPQMLLEALYSYGKTKKVIDGADGTELDFQRLLCAALALAEHLKKEVSDNRIGIALPPGKGAILANVAAVFAKKVPVNLNFTSSPEAVKSALEQASITSLVTAGPVLERFPKMPLPAGSPPILLDQLVRRLKPNVVGWMLKLKFMSFEKISALLAFHEIKSSDEAVVLFTSGSSGTPKGVPLTHRNILANICQFSSRVRLQHNATILGALPLFHSFGLTVTLWYPLLEGINLVTYTNPLDTKQLGNLIDQHEISLLTATPTFLRGYLKRVKPAQLRSLKLVVTGAEKLTPEVATQFEKKFGIRPVQGYGLTETSPVAYLNVPQVQRERKVEALPTQREGSVGLPLAGVAVRITHPETGQKIALGEQGLIWLKGSNIFGGYLGAKEKNAEVLQNGWFNTGDIGRVDEEGFLFIEGRLSRFSKIGGEMVSHEAVEAHLRQSVFPNHSEDVQIVVVGIPDEQKGESLVLLTTDQNYIRKEAVQELFKACHDSELPSLWRPKKVKVIRELPLLSSGKLDLVTCQKLAKRPV